MSRIKAGLELAEEIKQEEQLAEIQEEPTEETVEEFQEESIEETLSAIDESFDQALNEFNSDQIVTENLDSIISKCASLASKYFNSAGLQKEYDIAEYIKANTKKSVTEGIWGDFKRDFLGSKPRGGSAGDRFKLMSQSYARKSSEAKDSYDMDTAKDYRNLSWYFSIMGGNPPENIKDPDQFKHWVETTPALKMQIDRELKRNNAANFAMNELKEPESDEDSTKEYLKKLTRRKVRKEYEKSLPKGHTSLAKTYNLEEVENPKDKVTMDIPLLIRLLEYAREDAKTDMDLHDLTEKLVAMGSESGKTLSMSDYDQLVANQEETYEAKNHAMTRTKAIAKMEKNAPSFKKAMEKGKEKEIKEGEAKPMGLLPYILKNSSGKFSYIEQVEDLFDFTFLQDLSFDDIIDGMQNEGETAAKYISPRLSWLLKNMHDNASLNVIKPLAIKWMREMSPLLDDYVGRIIDKSPNYY